MAAGSVVNRHTQECRSLPKTLPPVYTPSPSLILSGSFLVFPTHDTMNRCHLFVNDIPNLSPIALISSVQFSSVQSLSRVRLCDPMNCSMPGLPVHHQLPAFTQTHVHRVSDAIQPSHPLSSPSPPAPNPSQHQSLFQGVNSSKRGGQSIGVLALASVLPMIRPTILSPQYNHSDPTSSQVI